MVGISRLICLLIFLLSIQPVFSQVGSVNYHIKFNPNTCLFDCCIIINEGSAITAIQRAQFNSQYSIVVPTGSNVSIAANRNPIQNNQTYKGTQPLVWFIGSVIQNPASLPGKDIYSITPTLTPTSFYNNLYAGDTIVLFSLDIGPVVQCGGGIRLFENGVDPDSNAPGMGGGDFSNGFTLGGVDQKYLANSATVYPVPPAITSITTGCSSGLEINLSSSVAPCQSPLQYVWKGPDGYVSSTEDVFIQNASQFNNGLYKVTITDNFGCKDSTFIQAYAKPNAGIDQVVSCFSSGTATLSAIGNGVWSVGSSSAGTASIQNVNQPVTTVSAFSNPGNYYLIWSLNGCSDTTLVTAGSNCTCNIVNQLNIPSEHLFCTQSTPLNLTGNAIINEQGNYTWIYKFNNQAYTNAPGQNTQVNYQTTTLNEGIHTFKRIFNKVSQPVCSDTSNFIEIQVLPKPQAGPNDTLFCFETDTAFLNTVSDGYWSLGQGSAGTVTFSSVTNKSLVLTDFSGPGNYYILRSNAICSDTTIVTINDWCGCDYAFTGNDTIACLGRPVQLSGNCKYGQWAALSSNPAQTILVPDGNGKVQIQFPSPLTGEYVFTYNVLGMFFDTIKVTVRPLPVVSLGEDFGFCESSGSVILTASGANTYIWGSGETSNSVMVSPQSTTMYIVTGTDGFGCSDTDSLTITFYEKPDGSIPEIPAVYESDPLILDAGIWQNAMTYQWSGPNNFSATGKSPMIPSATMANAGMYTLTVMSPNECSTVSTVAVQVYERALPVVFHGFEGNWNSSKKVNDIYWTVYSEVQASYYVLERSDIDGTDFDEIVKIPASEINNTLKRYQFTDVYVETNRTYFYRLKLVDADQRHSYLGIINIKTTGENENQILLYPNPATEIVNMYLKGEGDQIVSVCVLNSVGSILYQKKFEPTDTHTNLLEAFNPSLFANGMYVVKLERGEKVSYHRLLVVH